MTPATHSSKPSQGAPPPDAPARPKAERRGVVKWYSLAKGYGFIDDPEQQRDIFVHHSAIADPEELVDGDVVRFALVEGERGLQARDVERLDG